MEWLFGATTAEPEEPEVIGQAAHEDGADADTWGLVDGSGAVVDEAATLMASLHEGSAASFFDAQDARIVYDHIPAYRGPDSSATPLGSTVHEAGVAPSTSVSYSSVDATVSAFFDPGSLKPSVQTGLLKPGADPGHEAGPEAAAAGGVGAGADSRAVVADDDDGQARGAEMTSVADSQPSLTMNASMSSSYSSSAASSMDALPLLVMDDSISSACSSAAPGQDTVLDEIISNPPLAMADDDFRFSAPESKCELSEQAAVPSTQAEILKLQDQVRRLSERESFLLEALQKTTRRAVQAERENSRKSHAKEPARRINAVFEKRLPLVRLENSAKPDVGMAVVSTTDTDANKAVQGFGQVEAKKSAATLWPQRHRSSALHPHDCRTNTSKTTRTHPHPNGKRRNHTRATWKKQNHRTAAFQSPRHTKRSARNGW